MQKSWSDGYQERTSAEICSDLLTCYALAIQATLSACNQLQQAISRLASPKSPRVHLSVVCGRPVSVSSSTVGRRLRVAGKSARLTLVEK